MSQNFIITSTAVGKVICDSISTAEITYRDGAGNVLFTKNIGMVRSGDTITEKVPVPEDITLVMDR